MPRSQDSQLDQLGVSQRQLQCFSEGGNHVLQAAHILPALRSSWGLHWCCCAPCGSWLEALSGHLHVLHPQRQGTCSPQNVRCCATA